MNFRKQPLSMQTALTLLAVTAVAAMCPAQAEPFLPNFADEGKNLPGYMEPNRRFVVLNSGLANITAQRFALPASTMSYPLAGMTIFPWYQASPQLQEFLLNARVNNVPVTSFLPTPNLPPYSLPPTDLVRIGIPIPDRHVSGRSAKQLAMRQDLKDEVPWLVAHQSGQSFAVPGDPQALILVAPGTMFNGCALRTVALRCGTMWVITGARPCAVLTKYGALEVKPYSIAAVEQTWFNRVKAAVLYGHPLEIQFAYKGNTSKAKVEKGHELSISQTAVASSGTSDFVESKKTDKDELIAALPTQAPSPPANLDLITKKIDPDVSHFVGELKGVNPPLNNNFRMLSAFQKMFAEYGVTRTMRMEAIRKNALNKDSLAKTPASYKDSLDGRYFVPNYKPVIARGPLAFPRVGDELKTLWAQHGVAKYLSSSKLEVEQLGRLSLSSGEAVFEAKEPMYVRSNDCNLNIDKGAVVHVIAKKDLLVVRNLKEHAHNSVTLRVKGRTIDCAAGSELVVGADIPAVFAEMKNDGVNRRNVRSIETAQGSVIINKSEFDHTALMQYSPIMRKLYESKNEHDQKLIAQIVKMDAVLSVVTGKHGSYQRVAGLPGAH